MAPNNRDALPENSDPRSRLPWLLVEVRSKVARREAKFTRWKTAGFWIGGLAAVLGACAGIGVLTEWLSKDAAGALAVAGALASALVGFYDFDGRTVRVGIERGEWTRLLGDVMDLDYERQRSTSWSQDHRDILTALWGRYCDLVAADASARVRS